MSKLTRRDMLKTTAATSSAAVISWFVPRTAHAQSEWLLPIAGHAGSLHLFRATGNRLSRRGGESPDSGRRTRPRRQGGRRHLLHRPAARRVRSAARETWYMQGPWKDGTPSSRAISSSSRRRSSIASAFKATDDYCRRTFKQDVRRTRRRRSGRGAARARKGRDRARRRAGQGVLRHALAEHHRRLLRRPDLRRQPRFRRLEAGRLSRARATTTSTRSSNTASRTRCRPSDSRAATARRSRKG